MSGKKEKKHFIVGIIMVAIIVAATATMIYCYINRFDPQEYVQAFLDVSYKQKTESYIKQTGISEKEAKQIFEDNLDYTIEKFPEHIMTDEMAEEYIPDECTK